MRALGAFVFLVLGLVAAGTPVHAEGQGAISGQIVNITAGGSVAGGAQVALGVYRHDSLEGELKAQTDEDGEFRFDGLEVADDLTYQVGIVHGDMLYRSETVKLTDSQIEQYVSLRIYESTAEDPGLHASQVLVSLSVPRDGPREVVVTEIVRLANPSDRTFVPWRGGGAAGLVRFALPAGARGLEPAWGLDPRQVVQVNGGFGSLAPVPPGDSIFRFSYRVPFDSAVEELDKALPYGADLVRIVAEEGGPQVSGPALMFEEAREGKAARIRVWSAHDLSAGAQLRIELSDLPVPPAWAGLAGQLLSPWSLAGVVALVPLAGVFWTLRGRPRQTVAPRLRLEHSPP